MTERKARLTVNNVVGLLNIGSETKSFKKLYEANDKDLEMAASLAVGYGSDLYKAELERFKKARDKSQRGLVSALRNFSNPNFIVSPEGYIRKRGLGMSPIHVSQEVTQSLLKNSRYEDIEFYAVIVPARKEIAMQEIRALEPVVSPRPLRESLMGLFRKGMQRLSGLMGRRTPQPSPSI